MDKKQYILGSITIALIIGGTAYAIKRSYDKKKEEEEVITVEQARAIVKMKEYNPNTQVPPFEHLNEDGSIEMDDMKEECRVEADWNASFTRSEKVEINSGRIVEVDSNGRKHVELFIPGDEENIDEDEEESTVFPEGHGFYDDVNFNEPLAEHMTEEDKQLRYDPNSVEALQQFIKMELAEWVPMEDTYQTMLRLFDVPFRPQNDGDHMMMTKIIDYRAQFFGITSRWTKEITYADVISRFGRLADYNVNGGYRYWVDYILEFNDLHHTTSQGELFDLVERLNSHTYFNPRTHTYGLFGLTQFHHEQALNIASGNIDNSLTYEIEFEELMKSVIS